MEKVHYNPEVLSIGDRIEYSDNLELDVIKYVGPTKIFSDTTVLNSGSFIGEIHLNPLASEGQPHLAVAKDFAAGALRGLWNVAYDCENDDEYLSDVVAFHGVSDIIRPTFAQTLRLPADSLTLYGNQEWMKRRLSLLRRDNHFRGTDKDVYELWLSRNQLISTRGRLGELYNRL